MPDGLSHTIMVGEMGYQMVDYYFTSGPYSGQRRGGNTSWSWGYARYSFGSTLVMFNTFTVGSGTAGGPQSGLHAFRSDHGAGGCNFLFGDGSVHFFTRRGIDLSLYHALGTRNGREPVSENFL